MYIALCAVLGGFHGKHHAEKAIDRHKNENVDAHVGTEIHQGVRQFAEKTREIIRVNNVDIDRVWNTHQDEREISNGQMKDQGVGRVTHLFHGHHSENDENVSDRSDDEDEGIEWNYQVEEVIGSFVHGREILLGVQRGVGEIRMEKGWVVVRHDIEVVEKKVEGIVAKIEVRRRGGGERGNIRGRGTR